VKNEPWGWMARVDTTINFANSIPDDYRFQVLCLSRMR